MPSTLIAPSDWQDSALVLPMISTLVNAVAVYATVVFVGISQVNI